MAKYKKTLNDMDRLWIDHNEDASVDTLSKKLKATAETIRKYREDKPAPSHQTTTTVKKKNAFAKKGGAVVMTEAQSQIGDTVKHSKPEYMKTCVHTFDSKDND